MMLRELAWKLVKLGLVHNTSGKETCRETALQRGTSLVRVLFVHRPGRAAGT